MVVNQTEVVIMMATQFNNKCGSLTSNVYILVITSHIFFEYRHYSHHFILIHELINWNEHEYSMSGKFLHYIYIHWCHGSHLSLWSLMTLFHRILRSLHHTHSPVIPAARNGQEQGKGRVRTRGAESTPNSAGFGRVLPPPGAFVRPPSSPEGPLGMLHHLQDMAASQMRRETEEPRGSARRTILPWPKHKAH